MVWKRFTLKTLLIAGTAALVLLVSGCTLGTELDGVWMYNPGPLTEIVTLSRFAIYDEISGMFTGSFSARIDVFSESTKHIRMTVTTTSGDLSSFTAPGEVLYCTYAISGNQMLWAAQTGSYPASAVGGPYVRQ